MKKFAIFTFLLFSFLVVSVYAGPMMLLSQDESADDYSDIVFWSNAEGTWNAGTSYTIGGSECTSLAGEDTECSINSAFAEETGSPLVGSSSFDSPTGYDRCLFSITDQALSGGSGRMGADISVTTLVDGASIIFFYDTSPSNFIRIELATGNKVRAYVDEGGSVKGTILSTTADFDSVGHFIELAWDFSVGAGSDYLKLYVDGVLEASDSTITVDEGITFNGLVIGNAFPSGADFIFDQVIISTDPLRDINALKALTSAPTGSCP